MFSIIQPQESKGTSKKQKNSQPCNKDLTRPLHHPAHHQSRQPVNDAITAGVHGSSTVPVGVGRPRRSLVHLERFSRPVPRHHNSSRPPAWDGFFVSVAVLKKEKNRPKRKGILPLVGGWTTHLEKKMSQNGNLPPQCRDEHLKKHETTRDGPSTEEVYGEHKHHLRKKHQQQQQQQLSWFTLLPHPHLCYGYV